MIERPMLAACDSITFERFNELQFPLWATPKKDGIRMLVGMGKYQRIRSYSRKLFEIPNLNIQDWVENRCLPRLDGEIIIPDWTFHEIQSWCMTQYTVPRPFEYHVFDYWIEKGEQMVGYLDRLQLLQRLVERLKSPRIKILLPVSVPNPIELEILFSEVIIAGHEGLILRSADGPYKQGRSTFDEGYMLKLKQWEDAEGEIIGFEPLYENNNPQEKDHTGYAKRSSHKHNLKATDKLGAFIVRDIANERTFKVGSGFTELQRTEYWTNRKKLIGKVLTFKYQVQGEKDKPRSPIFKGIRRD